MKKFPANYGYTTDYGNVISSFQASMLLPENVSVVSINKQLRVFSDQHYNTVKKQWIMSTIFFSP